VLIGYSLAYHCFYITSQRLVLGQLPKVEKDQGPTQEKLIIACKKITSLFEMVRATITFSYFSVYHAHACSVCAYTLLDLLSRPECRESFHIAIVGLSAASKRWAIAHGIVKMIWITIHERKLGPFVQQSTMSLLKLGAVDKWGPKDHQMFEACSYPNYAAVAEKGRRDAEMGELLSEYSRLNLESEIAKESQS